MMLGKAPVVLRAAAAVRRPTAVRSRAVSSRPLQTQLPLGFSRPAAFGPAPPARLRSVVRRAGEDDGSGYVSAEDEDVKSGKVKAISKMSVAELKEELTARGLDANGAKPELTARLKAARSGKELPAAGAFAAAAAAAADPSKPAAKKEAGGSDAASLAKQVARLEEELLLARQMGMAAVTRAEKAEAALARLQGGGEAGGASASTSPALLRVTCKLSFGDSLLCCGSHAGLGSWDVAGAAALSWSDGDVWQAQVSLPQEGRLELKFLVRTGDGALIWQAGANLVAELSGGKGAAEGSLPDNRRLAFTGALLYPGGDRRAVPTLTVQGPHADAPEAPPQPAAAAAAEPPKKEKAAKKEEAAPAPAPEPAPPAAPEAAAPAPAPEAAPPAPESAPPAAEPAPAPAAEAPAPEAPAAEAPPADAPSA